MVGILSRYFLGKAAQFKSLVRDRKAGIEPVYHSTLTGRSLVRERKARLEPVHHLTLTRRLTREVGDVAAGLYFKVSELSSALGCC